MVPLAGAPAAPAPAPGEPDRIPPHPRPWRATVSLTAFLLAALLTAAAVVGHLWAIVAVLAVLMALLTFGWVPLLRLPSPRSTTTVQLVSAGVLLVPGVLAPTETLDWLPGAVALAMVITFVHQLARLDARPRLVESVSASASGVALLSSAVCILPLAATETGRVAIAAVAAATGAATLADVRLWRAPRWSIAVACAIGAVLLGGVAAVVTAHALGDDALPRAAVAIAGVVAAAASYALRQVQSVLPSLWGRRAQFASAAGSVLAVGVVAYGLAWYSGQPGILG